MTSSLLDATEVASWFGPDFVTPAFTSWPDHVKTYGDDVCDFGAAIGRPMDDEQRLALRIIYSVTPENRPACFEVGLIAARQNLKTATMEVGALYDLFVAKTELGIWAAHVYDTTKETFLNMWAIVDAHDFLRRRLAKVSESRGDQYLKTVSNDRLRFRARALTGGRGLTTRGRLWLDEAFALQDAHMGSIIPTMATYRLAQVIYGSSAARVDSDVLRGIRDRVRAGLIGGVEWCAPTGTCRAPDCRHEKSATDEERAKKGCALDDLSQVRLANPSLEWKGRKVWRISQDYIRSERQALSPLEFARERMGWHDEPGLLTLFAGWAALSDARSSIATRLAFAIQVSPDRTRAVIASAGLRAQESDFIGPVCESCEHESCHGHMHVEPIEIRDGTGWVAPRMAELLSKHGARTVAVASSGPAASLIDELKRHHIDVKELSAADVMDADSQLFDSVVQGTTRHMNYPELNADIEHAEKRVVGRRWVFEARDADEDVAVLQAVSQAAWASRNIRPRQLKPLFAFS